MIVENEYSSRTWDVIPAFTAGVQLPMEIIDEMELHKESAGKSSWGTRNLLYSLVLSMRPKVVVEIGAHIGSAALVIGSALKANSFGCLFSLEPQEHYYNLLVDFIEKARLKKYVKPLKLLSTDSNLENIIGEKADIIFLDANHSYSSASRDIEICDSLIANNGLILLDDVGEKHSENIDPEKKGGVRRALLDFCADRDDLNVIFFEPPFWLNPCGLALVCKQNVK